MSDQRREVARIRQVYERRKELPRSRLYSALVPSTLFTVQTRERVLLRILRRFVEKPPGQCRVLDAGCGNGDELGRFMYYGFAPGNLYGIDLVAERAERARSRYPEHHFVLGNAAEMPWPDGFFDIVIQSMMFSSILDRDVLHRAGAEMLRVVSPGGIVISYDMRVTRPDNPDVIPIRKRDLRGLWPGTALRFYTTTLAPPIVRRIAGWSWMGCELLYGIPWLRSHYMAVARKPA